jgi:phytoene synthase
VHRYYQQALKNLPEVDRYRQRSGLIMAEIYLTLLNEIEKDGFRVLERRVALTPCASCGSPGRPTGESGA